MKIVAITQARVSSTRLPGKVLKNLGSKTVLDLHLKRIKLAKNIDKIIVATTDEPEAEKIVQIADANDVKCFQGSLQDVLDRFYKALEYEAPVYVVRLTSDCPLIDPIYIDDAIDKFLASGADYAANCLNPTLPDGIDVEVFKFEALKDAWQNAKLKSEREHVTSYIRDCGKFKIFSIEYPVNWGEVRLTLDTFQDYEVLNELVKQCGEEASLETYVNYLSVHPELAQLNSKFQRNENYKKI